MIRFLFVTASFVLLHDAFPQTLTPTAKAPAENPPRLERESHARQPTGAAMSSVYSIGEPTDDEQLYLELINRARLHPVQEAAIMANHPDPLVQHSISFFSVNTNALYQAMAALPVAPPLAMNAQLSAAARLHNQDQFDNVFQGHVGSSGSTLGQRVTATGYNWTSLGENAFASARSTVHGHAGFEIDWGNGPDGMQNPPGHRISIHNANYREIGIGVINGRNESGGNEVGPQLVTQDFGRQTANTPFITGVAYYDFNGNNFYDPGEGLGGITVTVSGSSFHAITAGSGGYSVPVSGNGNYNVTFAGTNFGNLQTNVTLANNENVKVDFIPSYQPASVTGSATPSVGANNSYFFSPVGGATAYDWKAVSVSPFNAIKDAENDTNGLILEVSNYHPVSSERSRSGSFSYHLAHPAPATDQFLRFPHKLRPTANSRLQFHTRLGFATANQTAKAEITADGGATWTTLWSQTGDQNSSGDPTFFGHDISLAAYAGQIIQVRFVYDHTGGTFFPQTSGGVGFYFDDVTVTDADELSNETISAVASGASFQFNPSSTGNYLLAVRAHNLNRVFPFGPGLPVAAVVGPPPQPPAITAQPQSVVTNQGATITLSVTATSSTPPNFQWIRNGAPITDETASTLTLANVNRASGGSYTVAVTNPNGTVTSDPAIVRVRVAQTIQIPTFLAGNAGLRLLFRDRDNGALTAGDIANFHIEFSKDFSTWTQLPGTPTAVNGSLQIDDTTAPQQTLRFYRIRED